MTVAITNNVTTASAFFLHTFCQCNDKCNDISFCHYICALLSNDFRNYICSDICNDTYLFCLMDICGRLLAREGSLFCLTDISIRQN